MSQGTTKPATVSLGFGLAPQVKAKKSRSGDTIEQPGRKPHVMVVDQDAESRRMLASRLSVANYLVTAVDSAQEALDASVRTRPHLVITELKLQPIDGFALLKELKSRWPEMTVIILTAHGTIPDAVRATQAGAFGFLVKPIERDELLEQVQRAISVSTFTRVEGDWRASIVARSKLMEDRLAQANSAAAVNAPVLLTGQNGTGKELLARAIHAASPRREQPFLVINCRQDDEALLERLLFGANAQEDEPGPGALQAATGGTLLLEEVGALPLRLQARLVTEVRLDPGRSDGQDVRIIATTSRDLKEVMTEGHLRQDLYYQLNVMPIEVPPLGRRREDIPLLVSHFLEQATEGGGTKKIYSRKAIELLATTDWPGNVRQLFELVKRNVALSSGSVISEEVVRESLGSDGGGLPSYHEARQQFSREYLVENLQRTGGNVSEAARLAKRHRSDFYTLLNRFRLNANDFKSAGPAVSDVEESPPDLNDSTL
jgi:two-component system response regulator GlrR